MPSAGSCQTGCRLARSTITTPPSFKATANLVVVGSMATDAASAATSRTAAGALRSTTRATSSRADPGGDALHVADRVGDQRPPIPDGDAEGDDVDALVGGGVPADDGALAEADDPVAVDEHGPRAARRCRGTRATCPPPRTCAAARRATRRSSARRTASTPSSIDSDRSVSARVGAERGETAGLRRERRVACGVGRVSGAAPLLEGQRAGHEGDDGHDGHGDEAAAKPAAGPGLPTPRRLGGGAGSPRGTPARRRSGRPGGLANQSSASSRRAPRYSSPSSRPAPSQLRAASVRWRWTRRPSRSSSSQPRSRGHWRISASWATSTVGSRLAGSRSKLSSRAAPNRSITAPVAAIVAQLRDRHPPPGVLGPLAERDEAAEQPAQRRPLLGRRVRGELLGPAGQRAGHPAELPVGVPGQQLRRPGARTARSARTAAAAARRAGRRRRPRSRETSPGSNSQPTAAAGSTIAASSSSGASGVTATVDGSISRAKLPWRSGRS